MLAGGRERKDFGERKDKKQNLAIQNSRGAFSLLGCSVPLIAGSFLRVCHNWKNGEKLGNFWGGVTKLGAICFFRLLISGRCR
jgi:hypothetical protein